MPKKTRENLKRRAWGGTPARVASSSAGGARRAREGHHLYHQNVPAQGRCPLGHLPSRGAGAGLRLERF